MSDLSRYEFKLQNITNITNIKSNTLEFRLINFKRVNIILQNFAIAIFVYLSETTVTIGSLTIKNAPRIHGILIRYAFGRNSYRI